MTGLDRTLVEDVYSAVNARPRRFLTASIVLGCLKRETGLVGTFSRTDKQLGWNLDKAFEITGVDRGRIAKAFLIDRGPMRGMTCKFNVEDANGAYWSWVLKDKDACGLDLETQLRLCAGLGIGQFMGKLLVAKKDLKRKYILPVAQWSEFLLKFMSSRRLQILYTCGELENLLLQAHSDVQTPDYSNVDPAQLALTRYNAGPGAKHVTDYGRIAGLYAQEFTKELATLQAGG